MGLDQNSPVRYWQSYMDCFGVFVLFCLTQLCSGLEESSFGAKSDFKIWEFKVFFWGPEKSRWPHPKILNGKTTSDNLKMLIGPLYSLCENQKRKKVNTKMKFCFGLDKSPLVADLLKKRKSKRCFVFGLEKRARGCKQGSIRTFYFKG